MILALERNQSVVRIHCVLPEKKERAWAHRPVFQDWKCFSTLQCAHQGVLNPGHLRDETVMFLSSTPAISAADVDNLVLFLPAQGKVVVQEQRGFEQSCLGVPAESSISRISVQHRLLLPIRCEAPLC